MHSGAIEKLQKHPGSGYPSCRLSRPGHEAGVLATQLRVADALSGGSLQNVRNRLITSLELKESMITENIWEQQCDIKV